MARAVSTHRLALFAALCLPLLLGGCLEYREVVTLNAEGGGSVAAELTLDVGLLRELSRALGEEPEADDLAAPGQAEVLDMLSVEGVTVRELEVEQQGPRTWIRLLVDFEDLAALHRLEGFGALRRLELYDHGDGEVLVVSRLDARDVLPPTDLADHAADGEPLPGPEARALAALVRRLRTELHLESELRLPGPIRASNAHPDARAPGFNAGAWVVAGRRHPERVAELDRSELLMKVRCDRTSVPWAQDLPPAPPGLADADAEDAARPAVPTTAAALTAAPGPAAAPPAPAPTPSGAP